MRNWGKEINKLDRLVDDIYKKIKESRKNPEAVKRWRLALDHIEKAREQYLVLKTLDS